MNNQRVHKTALSLLASGLLLGAAACGDDDSSSDEATSEATAAPADTSSDTTAAPATTAAPDTTDHTTADTTGSTQANPEAKAFCQAELEAEAAGASGEMAALMPALEALQEAAPAEVAEAVEGVVANAESGPGSPEFDAPYGEMVEYVKDNCGFNEMSLTASEYAFGGLPSEAPSGPTVITLENIGEEFHEIILMRVNDGVTETAEELLAMPEEEAMSKATMAGFALAPTGASGNTVVDLQPGRYIAVCFLPKGATPELMEQMEGPESSQPEGAGPPHFTEGMLHEFQVA